MANRIRPGEFVALGASTGFGKSGLAERVALQNAKHHRVAYVSLEMIASEVQERMLGKLMLRDLEHVGKLRDLRDPEFVEAAEKLQALDLLITHPEPKKRTIQDIQRYAEDVTADLLIIDYADCIRGWKQGDPASDIVEQHWEWIKATRITTLLVAQVKRPSTPGGKRYRPTIHDFSDTRAIENKATRAIMLFLRHSMRAPAKITSSRRSMARTDMGRRSGCTRTGYRNAPTSSQ